MIGGLLEHLLTLREWVCGYVIKHAGLAKEEVLAFTGSKPLLGSTAHPAAASISLAQGESFLIHKCLLYHGSTMRERYLKKKCWREGNTNHCQRDAATFWLLFPGTRTRARKLATSEALSEAAADTLEQEAVPFRQQVSGGGLPLSWAGFREMHWCEVILSPKC